MEKNGNIYGIMNGAHYGRDPYERQERREAVREAMNYERNATLMFDREMVIRNPMERDTQIIENPKQTRIEIYQKRPSRF
jgi:hypothetical protein